MSSYATLRIPLPADDPDNQALVRGAIGAAPVANPTFTGTVTLTGTTLVIDDGALAIPKVSGLQTALDGKLATDGDGSALTDLTWSQIGSTPTTLSGYGITDAATNAQGALADTALQPGDNITNLTNNVGYIAPGIPWSGWLDAGNQRITGLLAPFASDEPTTKGYTDAALAAKQPLDADLTAIAALSTTSFGRALLAVADDDALRTYAGLGTAATADLGGTASGNAAKIGMLTGRFGYFHDFTGEPDSAAGVLPDPEIGSAYTFLGYGGSTPATVGGVSSGVFTTPVGSSNTVYACQQLPAPPDEMGAVVRWESGGGVTANDAVYVLASGTFEDSSWIHTFVHIQISRGFINIGVGPTPSGLRQLAYRPWQLSLDTDYQVRARFNGDRLEVMVGDYRLTVRDPLISRYHGKYCFWEIFYSAANSDDKATAKQQWATVRSPDDIGPGTTAALSGPDAKGGAGMSFVANSRITANASALPSIGTGDFFVFSRVKFPPRGQTVVNHSHCIWQLNGSSTGTNNGTGPRLTVGNATTYPELRLTSFSGSANTVYRYSNEVTNILADKWADILVIRRSGVPELYINGVYQIPSSTIDTSGGAPFSTSISSTYMTVGNSGTGNDWHGVIQSVVWGNSAYVLQDANYLGSFGVPMSMQWATGTTLTTGTLTVGKRYRVYAQATSNYWYSGSAVGDEFEVVSTSAPIYFTNLKTGVTFSATTATISATNTVVEIGAIGDIDLSVGANVANYDRGGNALASPITGSPVHAINPVYATLEQIQTSTPTTGGTVVCTADSVNRTLYLTPAGTLATLTVTLPANATARLGQVQRIATTQELTALTIDGASTITGNVTTLAAGGFVAFQKVADDTWTRIA